ncbi:MAG: hypothetical protein PVF17_11195 [Ignavibacteria bacterium]|jgi:hypothetical protein
MFDKTKPMNLGDIFNITINLIKETFLRNLIIASIFFIPAGIVFAFGFDYFISTIMNSVKTSIENGALSANQDFSWDIVGGLSVYGLVFIALMLSTIAVTIGVTYIGCKAMNGIKISVYESIQKIFSIALIRTIGLSIMLVVVFCALFGFPFIFFILAQVCDILILSFIGLLALIAALIFIVFFFIRWYFAYVAIVCEDLPVFRAFGKSFALVKNYWWRTFGLIILISITVQFAVSMVTTPLSFIVMWDFISEYFKLIASGDFSQGDPNKILSIMGSFGYSFGIMIAITSILQYILAPLFTVTLYYDLRIRKNEFKDDNNSLIEEPTIV